MAQIQILNFEMDRNSLERKDMLVFVNEVDGRDLTLDNVPPKHG